MTTLELSPSERLLVLTHRRATLTAELDAQISELQGNGTAKAAPKAKPIAKAKAPVEKKAAGNKSPAKKATKATKTNGTAPEAGASSLNGLVLATLSAAKDPVDIKGIESGARKRGWTTSAAKPTAIVRMALGDLKKKGLIESAGRGLYRDASAHATH